MLCCRQSFTTKERAKNAGASIRQRTKAIPGALKSAFSKTFGKANSQTNSQKLPLDGELELCILANNVGLYPSPPETINNDGQATSLMTTSTPPMLPPNSVIRLLSGPLDQFHLYSGQEQSQWLIDMAHDICDPSQKRGLLQVQETEETWRDVAPTDPLTASIYLYNVQHTISLTKISRRQGASITSSGGKASTMWNHVEERDLQQCWVSRFFGPLVNSHVCPKRMGDHLLRVIYRNFVSATVPPTLSIHDEICGITLCRNLDAWFDVYELGLRLVSPNVYECHSFPPPHFQRQRTIYGEAIDPPESIPLLHRHRASPPQPQHPFNPPPGLIRWHYLQCVVRKFAHSDYKSMQNIAYYELRLQMESDDEGTNEHGWPTAALDNGRAVQMDIQDHEERQRNVSEWVATAKQ